MLLVTLVTTGCTLFTFYVGNDTCFYDDLKIWRSKAIGLFVRTAKVIYQLEPLEGIDFYILNSTVIPRKKIPI